MQVHPCHHVARTADRREILILAAIISPESPTIQPCQPESGVAGNTRGSWWFPLQSRPDPDKPVICTDGPKQIQGGTALAPVIHRVNRPGKLTGSHPILGHPWFVVSVPIACTTFG
jgi:hypothetical protein